MLREGKMQMIRKVLLQLAAGMALSCAALAPAAASPLGLLAGVADFDGGLLVQAEVRCGDNGCWEVDGWGNATGRRYYDGRPSGRGMGPTSRRYVSPQAGVRCGDNGCWENDRFG